MACWSFRGSAWTLRPRWRSAGDSARSTTPSDGHHPVAGIYPVTLDKSKNSSADYLRATFDWHIDGCTPTNDECPQKATVLSAKQVAERGGETEFANSYAAYEAFSDEEKERFGRCGWCIRWRRRSGGSHPDPSPELVAKWRSRPTHEHPLVWTHRSGRKSLVLGASADYVVGMDLDEGRALLAELLDRATRAGQGVQPPLVGRGHRHLGQPRRPAPGGAVRPRAHHGRCCARRCWATNRSSSRADALSRCTAPSLTAASHCGNLIPTYENHVLVPRS